MSSCFCTPVSAPDAANTAMPSRSSTSRRVAVDTLTTVDGTRTPTVDAMAGKKRGALFLDLDGTLADSGAGITSALDQVFNALGTTALTEAEKRFIIGPAFQVTMPVLLGARGLDESMSDSLIREYRRIYTAEHLPLTPRALRMEHMMEIVIGPEPDAPTPKARLLERAITHVRGVRGGDLGHEECWMIGDRHHDIDAAVEVGTRSIGVMWGYGDEAELASAGATHIAQVPADLLTLLG
ncbi:MAG: hypothetical protein EBS48_01010 [Actinobacteria bacterium]|nr:hypothetical protein [Actinomycetota bacterium]